MSEEFTKIILGHVASTGAKGDPQVFKKDTRAQNVFHPHDSLGVLSDHKPKVHFPVLHNFQKPFNVHTGTPVLSLNIPGFPNSVVTTVLDHAPQSSTPPNGTSDYFSQRFGSGGSPNPIDQATQEAVGHSSGQPKQKGQTPVVSPNSNVPFIKTQQFDAMNSGHGASGDERNVKWEKRTAIKTAESAFGSVPSLGMLRGLPGSVMSLAGSFKGLSKQQKQKIQENTSPQMYSLIEATMLNTTDIGDTEKYSLTSRVHPETFANNMVELLSQCENYEDLRSCLYELRSNTSLHGKDQLPTIEYRIKNTFGETGLVIDGHGEYKQNVSAEVAKAEADFMQFITQGTDSIDILAKFEGQIIGNSLTVIHVDFGKLEKGQNIYIEGPDVTNNTQILKFETGSNGDVGLYTLTLSSNTLPNTAMILYSAISKPEQPASSEGGGGGGGGGLGGLVGFFNTNMFGEAAKLMGEQMPVLDPKAAGAVQQVLSKIQSNQQLHRASKFLAVARQFAGKALG